MCYPFWCVLKLSPVVDMSLHGDHEGGAAKRRRDRRLRMHWRHEQLTLQMALAAALHHSRDVGPVTYKRSTEPEDCQGGGHEQRSAEPDVECGRGSRALLVGMKIELGGTRPDRMYEVRPQERVQRHTVGQIVDNTHFLPYARQVLTFPCLPQMEKPARWTYAGFSMSSFPSMQLSKCPRSRPTRCPHFAVSAVCRFAEQMAEQLVEVPTIISYSSLQSWTVEQSVNIPVPGRGGQHVGLQGFLPRQRSTALQASQERSSERIVEQSVDSLCACVEVLQRLLRVLVNTLVKGFFGLFPKFKKSPKLGSHSGSELPPRVEPIPR